MSLLDRLVAAVAIGLSVGMLLFLVGQPVEFSDGQAYWDAAVRLREGLPLYPPLASEDASSTYRYAPWFAVAWIPLTQLPFGMVAAAWTSLMLVSSATAILPSLRSGPRGWILAAAGGSMLVWAALGGNVHPAMVLLLVYTLGTRWGPVGIALCASLKVFPVLFALVYLARGEYQKALFTVALTAALWAPALLFGVDNYPARIGNPPGLWSIHPLVWAGACALIAGLVVLRPTWLRASVLVAVATVRFVWYDLGYLLITKSEAGARTAHPRSERLESHRRAGG